LGSDHDTVVQRGCGIFEELTGHVEKLSLVVIASLSRTVEEEHQRIALFGGEILGDVDAVGKGILTVGKHPFLKKVREVGTVLDADKGDFLYLIHN
jgi:hypothetical protein